MERVPPEHGIQVPADRRPFGDALVRDVLRKP
jgi:hypothetical protein